MSWVLQSGKARKSLEAMSAQGAHIPQMEGRKPLAGFVWLYSAFFDLHGCRNITMGGPMPIPWSAVNEYAQAKEMGPDETFLLEEVVGHLDTVWLRYVSSKL